MKHINLTIENETHEQYKKLRVSWLKIIRAGLEIIDMSGSYEAYKKLVQKIKAGKNEH